MNEERKQMRKRRLQLIVSAVIDRKKVKRKGRS